MYMYMSVKRLVSYCGLFCPSCTWRNGVIRSVAKEMLSISERSPELRYIPEDVSVQL